MALAIARQAIALARFRASASCGAPCGLTRSVDVDRVDAVSHLERLGWRGRLPGPGAREDLEVRRERDKDATRPIEPRPVADELRLRRTDPVIE
jgi:hypothetical protein